MYQKPSPHIIARGAQGGLLPAKRRQIKSHLLGEDVMLVVKKVDAVQDTAVTYHVVGWHVWLQLLGRLYPKKEVCRGGGMAYACSERKSNLKPCSLTGM